MNDIKITVKKSEIEYCFKADNVEEFEKRFDAFKEIIRQRLINEISKCDADAAAADVQPVKHGRWSECYTDSHHCSFICSVCGRASIKSLTESLYKYCPKCGADMREEYYNE